MAALGKRDIAMRKLENCSKSNSNARADVDRRGFFTLGINTKLPEIVFEQATSLPAGLNRSPRLEYLLAEPTKPQ